MLLQPQMEQKEVLKLKNTVVCVLDNSMSMTLKGGDTGIARSQLVDNFFKENASFIEKLQDEFDVDYVTFSDTVKEISSTDVGKGVVYDGANTDVVRMLQYLKKRYEGKSVKGYFVFPTALTREHIHRASTNLKSCRILQRVSLCRFSPLHRQATWR